MPVLLYYVKSFDVPPSQPAEGFKSKREATLWARTHLKPDIDTGEGFAVTKPLVALTAPLKPFEVRTSVDVIDLETFGNVTKEPIKAVDKSQLSENTEPALPVQEEALDFETPTPDDGIFNYG